MLLQEDISCKLCIIVGGGGGGGGGGPGFLERGFICIKEGGGGAKTPFGSATALLFLPINCR